MKKSHKIAISLAIPFALVAGITFDYQYDKSRKETAQKTSRASSDKLKQEYDQKMLPALVDLAMSRCGEGPELGRLHGTLAARFIFDSNANDKARLFLKSKNADPYHYGTHEMPGGDGYMSADAAIKFAKYLLDNNIAVTAEPDVSKGQHQAEYVNNGTGGGHLKFFYHPAPSDIDGKDKPWIPEQDKQIPADGIYVPMSAALGSFLHDLMNGKYGDVALYQVRKSDRSSSSSGNNWEIAKFAPNRDVEIIPHLKDAQKPQVVMPAASVPKLVN